ncbi:hypothetical protein Tco_1223834, partial [Tanacetum coccineum]
SSANNTTKVTVVVPSVRDGHVLSSSGGYMVEKVTESENNKGKRVAYPVVANYVRNTWSKYGLVKSILNSTNELFSSSLALRMKMSIMFWFGVKLYGVPMTEFSDDGLSVIATKLGTPLMLYSYTSDMCKQSWVRSSYAEAMIEFQANVELKDTIVMAMPQLLDEGFYMCTICVEYEWKPPRCSSCKVFGHILDECPKNIGFDVAKNLKNPRQAARGVLVGPKVGFKPVKQVYRQVSKNIVNTSGKKKQDAVPRQEVSNSNPFDALNSIQKDDDLGTNGGNSKSAGNGPLNVAHGSSSNALIIDKIEN